ncbi:DMT family transporter [Paenibacillus sp. MMS18-CY102]|uniref:DMT family transporter n=1 Tax=Paenibacillus sp. MMS18-CY102 TaxID=2682849 RepID=UPI0013652031|nr:DMT family transporter [Paenibacillus sp. MMS18-CY102]MWC31183.1 EamA family transporter [Paenibacillus sp. MMS18-CY102]
MANKNKSWAYVGLVAVAAIWGANFGVSRLVMETFDPILFAFLRFGLAVPIFFGLLYWKEGSIGVPVRVALQLAIIGFVGITVLENAVMYSIKYTTLANASLLNVAPWPIFAALFAPLFTKESLTRRLAIGGFVAMAGVFFIIVGGEEGLNFSSSHMIGNLLAFGVSLLGALFNLACMPLMQKYSPLRVSAWFIAFGALFMLPLTFGSWGEVDWSSLGAGDYSAILYNVLLCTVAAVFVWNAAMLRVGAARSNFFRYVVPATAVAAGYLFFDEQITVLQMGGAALMAMGLVWITSERSNGN